MTAAIPPAPNRGPRAEWRCPSCRLWVKRS